MAHSKKWVLLILGFFLCAIYVWLYVLGDLRVNTVAFEWLFFSAFALYAIACILILQVEMFEAGRNSFIFILTVVMLAIMVLTRPTLSDDMYRYIWDGRVQSQGLSPYRYSPDAPELDHLRDKDIYPSINRKNVVTVYPPAAQAAFAVIWRIWPDNVQWFQIVIAGGALLAGFLLLGLLRDLGRSPARLLIFLWSPLLIVETAHAAHVDGLVLPLLVGAWWARVRKQDALLGILLGVATAIKFYPALLLPFLWRPQHPKGRWTMPFAFMLTLALFYIPFAAGNGWHVLGYLPTYFKEQFNLAPLVLVMKNIFGGIGLNASVSMLALTLGSIFILAVWAKFHPASNAEIALRRCLWPLTIVTLLSQNLFSWYLLWFLPLIAIFIEPSGKKIGPWHLPRADAWTGWWLFCGLVGLSYTFFINWRPNTAAIYAQFIPLYIFLLISMITPLWKRSIK